MYIITVNVPYEGVIATVAVSSLEEVDAMISKLVSKYDADECNHNSDGNYIRFYGPVNLGEIVEN